MLITLHVANSFKLANHLMDPEAIYLSDISIKTVTSKKGLIADRLAVVVQMAALDALAESFLYLSYDTAVQVFIDNRLVIDGYVTKISNNTKDEARFGITSVLAYKFKQSMAPKLSTTCNSQIYSVQCGLDVTRHTVQATGIPVHCLTGYFDVIKDGETLIIGNTVLEFYSYDGNKHLYDGNTKLVDAETQLNPLFLDPTVWAGMIVVINGKYKTRVTKLEGSKAYVTLNYLDQTIVAETMDFYLACDKTYGVCYKRFKNTRNFWGFPNVGKQVKTVDVFSADNLTYCGSDEAELPKEACPTDSSLFGVII